MWIGRTGWQIIVLLLIMIPNTRMVGLATDQKKEK
jgi:hypothetical protein